MSPCNSGQNEHYIFESNFSLFSASCSSVYHVMRYDIWLIYVQTEAG